MVLCLVMGFTFVSVDQLQVDLVPLFDNSGRLLNNLLPGQLHIIGDHTQAPLQLTDLLLTVDPRKTVRLKVQSSRIKDINQFFEFSLEHPWYRQIAPPLLLLLNLVGWPR